jgi:predicted NAD-dependent protein-ADP-ribosyltransferase YbiA (DUF1768 family)
MEEKNKIFHFFSGKKDGMELSNFHRSLIEIEDEDVIRAYTSGENAFHGMKYIEISKDIAGMNRKKELYDYGIKFEMAGEYGSLSGGATKKKGGKKGMLLTPNELHIWSNTGGEIQRKICRYKYEHVEGVRECLERNKDNILIHPALRVSLDKMKFCVWEGRGVVENGEFKVLGGNLLGKIWMEMRDNKYL